MLKDEILANALSIIESRFLHFTRCSETGSPVAQIMTDAIKETLEAYWLDNPTMSAERLADEWELTHYSVNFRISPLFQRTLIGQNRENRFVRLARTFEGRSRLFVYFLGHALFPQKRMRNGTLTYFTEKNQFVASCFDWTQREESKTLVDETVLNLAILEGMTNVAEYIETRKIKERIAGIIPILRGADGDFAKAIDSFVSTLFDALGQSDDDIQSMNTRIALPTAIALSAGLRINEEKAAARSHAMLSQLKKRLSENYAGGKTITRHLTVKQAADRLAPKKESTGEKRGPRANGMKNLSDEAKAEMMARISQAFSGALGGQMGGLFGTPVEVKKDSK